MKGYFSQLAQHTGRVIGPGNSSVASSNLSQAQAEMSAQTSGPLHIEEISFTSAPHDVATAADSLTETETPGPALSEPVEAAARPTEHRGPIEPSPEITISAPAANDAANSPWPPLETSPPAPLHIEAVDVTPPVAMEVPSQASQSLSATSEVSSEASPYTLERRGLLNEESGGRAGPKAEDRSEARSSFVPEHGSQPVSPELSEAVEIAEARLSAHEEPRERRAASDRKQPARRVQAEDQEPFRLMSSEEQTGVAQPGYASREATFQTYLREIADWVSAPPVLESEALEQGSRAQAQPTENALAIRHDSNAPSTSRPAPAEEEVQDLNLSIGTISVVIEEQKQQAVVLPPAPPRAENPTTRAATEPTSLSRYYLRSW